MERPQALLPGVITFCPCAEAFNPTSSVSTSRRLPPSRLHHTTRVQIFAGPNELRVAHIFPHIIRIFTLLRRRCTPDEYQHEHKSNCNGNELFHRFLLMIWRLRDVIKRPDPFYGLRKCCRTPRPFIGGMGGHLHLVVQGRFESPSSRFSGLVQWPASNACL